LAISGHHDVSVPADAKNCSGANQALSEHEGNL